MGLVFPLQGEQYVLEKLTNENITLHLYVNDVTGGLTEAQIRALDETDFTEATFTGYAAKTLTGGSWTVDATTNPAHADYAAQTWTNTGSVETVHGYWLERVSDGKLLAFEPVPGFTIAIATSDSITITPRITAADNGGDAVTIGTRLMWHSATPPTNYLSCDGSAVSRTTYSELFNTIGTTYGVGDGSTTFNLPNEQWGPSLIGPVHFTPTYTNFGAADEECWYTRVGNQVTWKYVGLVYDVTGVMTINLPFQQATATMPTANAVGIAYALEITPRTGHVGAIFMNTDQISFRNNDGAASSWNATTPFTWDSSPSSDRLSFTLVYETDEAPAPAAADMIIRAL